MYSFQGYDPTDPLGNRRRYEEMYAPQSPGGGMGGMSQPAGLQIPQGGGIDPGLANQMPMAPINPPDMGGGIGIQMPSPADAAARPDGMGLKSPGTMGGGAMGGSNMAGGLMAAGSALSKMANDGTNGTPAPPQISMRTPQAQDMQFQYLFPLIDALQELNIGRKRRK